MTTRPTRAVLVPLALAAVLNLLARVTGGGWLALGAGAALALPVTAWLLRPRLAGLDVRVDVARTSVGGSALVQVTVQATGRSTPPLRLRLEQGLLAAVEVAVPALPAGGITQGRVPAVALARGAVDGVAARVESTAPLGLLRVVRDLQASGRVVVRPVPTRPRARGGSGAGAHRQSASAGSGTEVLGLRSWRTGDPLHAVHARATARHGRPVVLEREREQGPRTVLLAGPGQAGPDFEAAVSRAAAVCLEVLRSGGEPVLVGAAPAPRPSTAAVLDWLAGLEAAGPPGPDDVARAARAAGCDGRVLVLGPVPARLVAAVPV